MHISVTFTYDLEKAEALYEAWQVLGVPVEVGGPAFDDRMGDFVPGMYVKPGNIFTSRGCTKDCWFCSVPRCAHGIIKELPIVDGYNIMDDNILGTSEQHFRSVIDMLKRQKERPKFTGGLEPSLLQPWQAELIHSVHATCYTAYDTKDDLDAIMHFGKTMHDAGYSDNTHDLKCYVLCGYDGDSFEEAEKRMHQVIDAGMLPFAMLYRNENGFVSEDWKPFQRIWANQYIVPCKVKEYLNGGQI